MLFEFSNCVRPILYLARHRSHRFPWPHWFLGFHLPEFEDGLGRGLINCWHPRHTLWSRRIGGWFGSGPGRSCLRNWVVVRGSVQASDLVGDWACSVFRFQDLNGGSELNVLLAQYLTYMLFIIQKHAILTHSRYHLCLSAILKQLSNVSFHWHFYLIFIIIH